MTDKKSFFAIAIILFLASGISAQTIRELRLGSTLHERAQKGEERWYSARAEARSFMNVGTTGNYDTYLEAYDSNRNLITSDDDSGFSYNATLRFIAEAGQTYYFRLLYNIISPGVNNGAYTITAYATPLPNSTELSFGQTIAHEFLPSRAEAWYSVKAASAGYISVIIASDLSHENLYLYDSFYEYIADELILASTPGITFLAEAGKTYFIKYTVSTSGFDRVRPYTISASFSVNAPTAQSRTILIR